MVLAHHLVNLEKSSETLPYDPCIGHQLPNVYMHTAQQVMTRADFIRQLDRLNIFTITPDSLVRASSVPMQRAFREICSEPGFEEHLEKTLKRIADIESLGRTRELVAKDLVGGASYEIEKGIQPRSRGSGLWSGRGKEGVTVRLRPAPEGDDGNNRNGDKA